MTTDTRRIHTAVLNAPHSPIPVVLPPDATNLDAFRRHHQQDTFWCGELLGGCGARLFDKLYHDRVCHFAHGPDPAHADLPCRSRGVESADHLYLQAAAEPWLRAQGHHPRFHHPHTATEPIGSLLEITLDDATVRVHLSGHPPQWPQQAGLHTLLGEHVRVATDLLMQLRYLHRVRFIPSGFSREVRIGTEAFGRETRWYTLEECALKADGLWTPAVEEITRARATPPPGRHRPTPHPTASTPPPAPQVRSEVERVVRALDRAQASGSLPTVERLLGELAEQITECSAADRAHAQQHLHEGRAWLERQRAERAGVYDALRAALERQDAAAVREALTRAEHTAARDRTREEDRLAQQAHTYLLHTPRYGSPTPPTAPGRTAKKRPRGLAQRQQAARDELAQQLQELERHARAMPLEELHKQIARLARITAAAGDLPDPAQRRAVPEWFAYAEQRADPAAPSPTPPLAVPRPRPAPARPPSPRRAAAAHGLSKKKTTKAQQRKRSGADERGEKALQDIARAVRGALKKAAREQTTTTWQELERALGPSCLPPDLPPSDKEHILRRVHSPDGEQGPLLWALLALNEQPARLYRRAAQQVGRAVPTDPTQAVAFWEQEAARVHAHWHHH